MSKARPQASASRIAARLHLDHARKVALSGALMTATFAGPDEVVALVRDISGLSRPAVDAAAAEIWAAQHAEAQPLEGALDAPRAAPRRT